MLSLPLAGLRGKTHPIESQDWGPAGQRRAMSELIIPGRHEQNHSTVLHKHAGPHPHAHVHIRRAGSTHTQPHRNTRMSSESKINLIPLFSYYSPSIYFPIALPWAPSLYSIETKMIYSSLPVAREGGQINDKAYLNRPCLNPEWICFQCPTLNSSMQKNTFHHLIRYAERVYRESLSDLISARRTWSDQCCVLVTINGRRAKTKRHNRPWTLFCINLSYCSLQNKRHDGLSFFPLTTLGLARSWN